MPTNRNIKWTGAFLVGVLKIALNNTFLISKALRFTTSLKDTTVQLYSDPNASTSPFDEPNLFSVEYIHSTLHSGGWKPRTTNDSGRNYQSEVSERSHLIEHCSQQTNLAPSERTVLWYMKYSKNLFKVIFYSQDQLLPISSIFHILRNASMVLSSLFQLRSEIEWLLVKGQGMPGLQEPLLKHWL